MDDQETRALRKARPKKLVNSILGAAARDLEEALAYERTPEELGESVIDLTGDVTPQSPAVPESSSLP